MPSILTRLGNLFPGFRAAPTPSPVPAVRKPDERLALVKRTQEQLEATPRRRHPATAERIPSNYAGGIAGKVWFLPYQDSATKDSADIRAAMRLMPRNPYVKAAWWTQVLSVASQDGQVQPSEPGNPESEEQAAAVAAMLDECAGGKPALAQAICTPMGPDGFTLAEKVWGVAERGRLEGQVVLKALKDKDPDYLRLKGDQYGNVQTVSANRKAGEEFPIGDFVFTRYLPIFSEPLGMAAFRAAYGEYWMLDTVEKLRAIHHEKRMAGMLLGEYENDDDKGPLEEALAKAKTATWISVPVGCKVTAIALSTATEPDYKSFVESKQTGIVTGISGASLQILQGTIPNARGDSKVQKSTSDLFPWLLAVLVQEAVTSQVIRDYIDFNYPYPAGGGYPRYTLGAVANAELLELIQVLEGAMRIGIDPSRKYYGRSLSIQQADKNDPEDSLIKAVKNAQPAAPPMGGMPALPPASGSPFTFGEAPFGRALVYESFGWQPARSRTGTTKAVGTGENAGSVLYGTDAETALASGDDEEKQDDDRDSGELRRLSDRVKAGDIDAGIEVHRRAGVYANAALAGERKPIDATTAKATWQTASQGLDSTHATAIGGHLNELTAGASSDPSVMRKAFGGLVGAIKAAGSLGVRAVAVFARGVQKQLGPYGWWAASLAAAAAIAAAPAAAAGLGLIGGWMALAATPAAAAGALSMRRVGAHLATKSAVKHWGLRAGEQFAERIDLAEVVDAMVHRFGWSPYQGKRGGKGWVSGTGEIRYQPEMPSDSGDAEAKPKASPKESAKFIGDVAGRLAVGEPVSPEEVNAIAGHIAALPKAKQAWAKAALSGNEHPAQGAVDAILSGKPAAPVAAAPKPAAVVPPAPAPKPAASPPPPPAPTPTKEAKPADAPKSSAKPNYTVPDVARPKLSEPEITAIKQYTEDDYDNLNRALRDGRDVQDRLGPVHASLQSAFAKSKPFKPPVVANRELSISKEKIDSFINAAKQAQAQGGEYKMNGYVSTTVDPSFTESRVPNVQMKINASHGLDLTPYSNYATQERELLLNHGSKFKVKSVEQRGKVWYIELDQV